MADLKHILVVDDHFDMLEFLRSMLETTNANYRVLGVPSAEEGFLELRRRARQEESFDLLITDVRLAGMSGFELARKVRDLQPHLPIIIITAYTSVQGRKEAEILGVHRYFEKPLDTDALLASVHSALYPDAGTPSGVTRPAFRSEPPAPVTAQQNREQARQATSGSAVRRRLQALLSDTGAVQALMCDRKGQIRFRVGARTNQPLDRVARLLARTLAHSFELAAELGSAQPFTIQYQAGEQVDLYSANVARHGLLILLFDARARRGRIGTVWIFAQRAIKDLLDLMPEIEDWADDAEAEQTIESPAPATRQSAKKRPGPEVSPARQLEAGKDVAQASSQAPASEHAAGEAAGEEALLDLLEQAADLDGAELEAFWDDATSEAGGGDMGGLSFDEAVERGLLPPDLAN